MLDWGHMLISSTTKTKHAYMMKKTNNRNQQPEVPIMKPDKNRLKNKKYLKKNTDL